MPDLPALTRLSSTPQKSCPVSSLAASVHAACGPVRRTASTGTPGPAFRPNSAQAAPPERLSLRLQTVRLRMRELEHAHARRMGMQEEARAGGKALPKPKLVLSADFRS